MLILKIAIDNTTALKKKTNNGPRVSLVGA